MCVCVVWRWLLGWVCGCGRVCVCDGRRGLCSVCVVCRGLGGVSLFWVMGVVVYVWCRDTPRRIFSSLPKLPNPIAAYNGLGSLSLLSFIDTVTMAAANLAATMEAGSAQKGRAERSYDIAGQLGGII